MEDQSAFDLETFMPYLLNQAADTTSRDFETYYKSKYGMLRTEWRVAFHLGRYGKMTAKEICQRARLHKTKVSRAVRALEAKLYLRRQQLADDRRHEALELTQSGQRVFDDLVEEARTFDAGLMSEFTPHECDQIRAFLTKIAKL